MSHNASFQACERITPSNRGIKHLGRLCSGKYFEGEVLVVTGKSGSGKTSEIVNMMANFNAAEIALPGGQNARMVSKELDRKGGWKDLGKKTLRAMGYPIEDNVRMSQSAIWERVAFQGRHQGIVSINYDEFQHILSGKEGLALEAELDSFKSILKSKTWPFLLVLSGIPELDDKNQHFEQLGRKVTHVTFTVIEYDDDASTVHEMMGSYALEARLEVSDDMNTEDFIHRLATAGECPIFCVTGIWSMLPERSKDDDHIQGIAGRTTEGLRAA
nr:AAA family ATPase [Pseudosulfitobacter pseudonitzschiae]